MSIEAITRIIITVLFIALIAISIVFFGIFGILPLKRLADVTSKESVATTTETGVTVPDVGVPEAFPEGVEEETPQPKPSIPETSPITDEGEVVTQGGEPVELDTEPGSPEAPQQSNPISEESLPPETIKLKVAGTGFSPGAFTVQSGQVVTLSVTSADTFTHIFKFEDPSLSAVAIGVGPDETRAIAFNSPEKGEYSFFCDVPGHAGRGETGVMIVE